MNVVPLYYSECAFHYRNFEDRLSLTSRTPFRPPPSKMGPAKASRKRAAPTESGPARKKAHLDKGKEREGAQSTTHRKRPVTGPLDSRSDATDDEDELDDDGGEESAAGETEGASPRKDGNKSEFQLRVP